MEILCLVDNAVKPLSRFWGEHGLSFLIDTGKARILFDTGATGTVLLHNLDTAGVETGSVDAVVLSHSHPDHTGGLTALMDQRKGIPTYAHPELLQPRFSKDNGEMVSRGLPMSPDTLQRQAELHLSESPQEVRPGVFTTGEVRERLEPEGRSPHHFIRDQNRWIPDPYRDDMSLVLETEMGLVVVCGCCHAGLLNTLSHVERVFGRSPCCILGGTHLLGAPRAELDHATVSLRGMGSPLLRLNHCTGEAAMFALSRAFGDRLSSFPAGTVWKPEVDSK